MVRPRGDNSNGHRDEEDPFNVTEPYFEGLYAEIRGFDHTDATQRHPSQDRQRANDVCREKALQTPSLAGVHHKASGREEVGACDVPSAILF